MANIVKILKILVVILFIFVVISNFEVMAYDVKGSFSGDASQLSGAADAVKTVLSTILDVVRLVGTGVAIIILLVVGAKFMMASPNERANIKQYSINYLIGAMILIGASGILTIIKTFAQTATGNAGS